MIRQMHTMSRGTCQKAAAGQRGLTLIEVLIAVLVLSIGLLGLAGLQATSLQFNHSAYLRTNATNLAYDMSDRMRINREAALAGQYALDFPDPLACNAGGLIPDGSVAQDIATWRMALACSLPSGTASIQVVNDMATITVRWDDTRGVEAAQEFSMMTRL